MSDPQNFYAEVGGAPVFDKIVSRFYEQVREDEVLRPLYPEEDLGPAEVRLPLPRPLGHRRAVGRCAPSGRPSGGGTT